MSRIRIIHTTTYQYAESVGFGVHRLVVRPREGHDVHLDRHVLNICPAHEVTWHRDVYGNSIALVRFTERSDRLEIQSDATLTRGPLTSIHGLLEAFPIKYPPAYSAIEAPLLSGYTAPVYPEEAAGLQTWVTETFRPQPGADAVALVHQVGLWIYKHIQYRRREDRGVQSPLQTLEFKAGSCRDMATLLLEAVRSIDIASRFASGYLHSASSEAGRAATHAWTEIYFPEHGWYGFDPTLGEGTSLKHIVTGVSSHPRGVMPVTGSYSGPVELYSGMTVSVKIEKLPAVESEDFMQPAGVGDTNIERGYSSL